MKYRERGDGLEKEKKKKKIPFTKCQAACVMGGFILYAALETVSGISGQNDLPGGGLLRAGPGSGDTSYDILVSGLDREHENKKLPVMISVRERQYTHQEAKELFKKISPEFKKQMLGKNKSLEEVREKLDFMDGLRDYGCKIKWESDNPELIDSFGGVHNEELSEKGKVAYIKAIITIGSYQQTYEFQATVYPPSLTPEEKLASAFKKWVDGLDLKQQTKDGLTLPNVYNGNHLTYCLPGQGDYRIIPVLGILLAGLLHMKEETDKQNAAKKRKQQLLFDYSEVVSKLVVYLGAGLTIRGAWERISTGYEEAVKQGKRSIRPAYEEMVKTASQLGSGHTEGRAFREFGRRCGLQSYLKLSALLEQSQKNGSRQLRSLLELEMISAFEQRKNLAKKLGEEAGTKLLLPLFFMLGVIMVMIVVPAFLSFY